MCVYTEPVKCLSIYHKNVETILRILYYVGLVLIGVFDCGVFFLVLGGNAGGSGVAWISHASILRGFTAAAAVKWRRDKAIRCNLCKKIGFE
jgi:hypothetical protein